MTKLYPITNARHKNVQERQCNFQNFQKNIPNLNSSPYQFYTLNTHTYIKKGDDDVHCGSFNLNSVLLIRN